ncbi:non-ribosomal peptide synthetase, partial [Pseudoalteromonas citrea]
LGILKAGGAYVPLDPSYPQERLSYMIEDAALKVVLNHEATSDVLEAYTGSVVALDSTALYTQYSDVELCKSTLGLTSSNLAYVIYTSGSTGKPKGVMIEHEALGNYQLHIKSAYGVNKTDSILQFSNMCFDIFVEEFFGALCHGAKLVLSTSVCRDGLREFVEFCNLYSVSLVSLPTAFWAQLVSDDIVCSSTSIETVIVGGEALTISTVREHDESFGGKVKLLNTYGPTEATITASTYVTNVNNLSAQSVAIGRANINNQLFILDENSSLKPCGSIGELYIGGDGLARGYLNRPDLTAERFIENPFHDAAQTNSSKRLYRTGDLVRYLPDGNLEFIGRADDQV